MTPSTTNREKIRTSLLAGFDALKRRQFEVAFAQAAQVLQADAGAVEAHMLMGFVGSEQENWSLARQAFATAIQLAPRHADAWVMLARTLTATGEHVDAEKAASNAAKLGPTDPRMMDTLGTVFSQLGFQERALPYFEAVTAKFPEHLPALLNSASVLTFLGRSDEACAALEAVLSRDPDNAKAIWMLARARKAEGRDRADAITDRLLDIESLNDRAMLAYAAGKLYEDCALWDQAFAAYDLGAKAKRQNMSYDEAADQALFDALARTCTPDWLAEQRGTEEAGPIFIVGQPRTGTTLVERVVSAHSDVTSADELQHFGICTKRASGIAVPEILNGAVVEAAAKTDMAALGAAYLNAARTVRGNTAYFVDKLPQNFLYLGFIAAALPNAKILHLTRDPLDACFASFKQLFANAYPHSYDQGEMARHYLRYRKLMVHWHKLLPGRILDVPYETLVTDLGPTARRIIEFIGLDWQDSCAAPHLNTSSVATASTLQVREAVHARSIGRARRFLPHLQTMQTVLSQS